MTARAARVGVALLLELVALVLLVLAAARPPLARGAFHDSRVLAGGPLSQHSSRRTATGAGGNRDRSPGHEPCSRAACDRLRRSGRPGTSRRVAGNRCADATIGRADAAGNEPGRGGSASHARRKGTAAGGAGDPVRWQCDDGDTARALEDAASAGVAVLWRTVAAASSSPRIGDVLAPARARPGQQIPVTIRMTGTTDRPLRVVLSAHDASLPDVTSAIRAGELGSVTLTLASSRRRTAAAGCRAGRCDNDSHRR